MENQQSDAKNKVIAPVFNRLGIIDQWGNGLRLVAEEMKLYPEIELRWQEVRLSFQVQFIKKGYKEVNDKNKKDNDGVNVTNDVTNVTDNSLLILTVLKKYPQITTKEIAEKVGLSERQCKRMVPTYSIHRHSFYKFS